MVGVIPFMSPILTIFWSNSALPRMSLQKRMIALLFAQSPRTTYQKVRLQT